MRLNRLFALRHFAGSEIISYIFFVNPSEAFASDYLSFKFSMETFGKLNNVSLKLG